MNAYMTWFRVALLGALVATSSMQGIEAEVARLDDATILAIFDQANTADIQTARLGVKHGHSEQVRSLGRMVARDHESVQQLGRELARKLNIFPSPPDNDQSVDTHAKVIAALQSKSGPEFDRVYLLHEIAFHEAVINAVKDTLLPAVKNPELKSLIAEVLPGFEHHLSATIATAKQLGHR